MGLGYYCAIATLMDSSVQMHNNFFEIQENNKRKNHIIKTFCFILKRRKLESVLIKILIQRRQKKPLNIYPLNQKGVLTND